MNQPKITGIDRSDLPESFLSIERRKSSLILEANLLKAQGNYEDAAEKFAISAELEEQLAGQLLALGKYEKAFFHRFSAVSCWAQAGNLYQAMVIGQQILQAAELPDEQREQVSRYLRILQSRFVQWMSQWAPESMVSG